MSRRAVLVGGVALAVAGCASSRLDRSADATGSTGAQGHPPSAARVLADDPRWADLERQFDVRLGLWALDTATGTRVEHNADQRFAFCSTAKAFMAAAVLNSRTLPALDQVVQYEVEADVAASSPITAAHVATGMTVRDLCDAAVRYSDNTAANLVFDQIGGPAGLQTYLQSLGDLVTNSARIEPALSAAVPDDLRDTTTPRAWGSDLQNVALGNALSPDKREVLVDWLVRNQTGATLIRAAVPAGWKVGDKTGNGGYGTRNDMAIMWPPSADPIVMVVMSTRSSRDDAFDDHLVAQAAAVALSVLR